MTNHGDMIIIGAGTAGLSAGCYARMNGYDVQIFEMHDKPGGMCTSWQRKGYTLDYCIHNLPGTAPGSGFRRIWDELGAFESTSIVSHDEFVCVESASGERFHWYTDLDRLDAHLREIAPDDLDTIKELIGAARAFAKADLLSMPLGGLRRTLKALPALPAVREWSATMMGQFATRFTNPFMRRAWAHAQYDIPSTEVPMMAPLFFMSGLHNGDLRAPYGGSLAFSRRIERRFLDLGGVIHYRSPVERILVEDGRAVGVRLADGSVERASLLVSAADGHCTIYSMLDGQYVTDRITRYYEQMGDCLPFGLAVYLGVQGDMAGEPHALTLLLDQDIDLGDVSQDSLYVVISGPDTGLAPDGHATIKVETQAVYGYWRKLRDQDPESYRVRKQEIADAIIDRLSPRFAGLRERIEVVDVVTLPTAEHYTGNHLGSQAGPPRENAADIQRNGLSHTLPGLDAFYHVGQWSNATIGVANAALTGRNLVKELCKKNNRRFTSH